MARARKRIRRLHKKADSKASRLFGKSPFLFSHLPEWQKKRVFVEDQRALERAREASAFAIKRNRRLRKGVRQTRGNIAAVKLLAKSRGQLYRANTSRAQFARFVGGGRGGAVSRSLF